METRMKEEQLQDIGQRYGVRPLLLEQFIQTAAVFTTTDANGVVVPLNTEMSMGQLAVELIESGNLGPRPEWATLYTRTDAGVTYDVERVLQRLEIAEDTVRFTQVGMLALLRGVTAVDIDKFLAFADRHFVLDTTGVVILRDDASKPLDQAVDEVIAQFKARG
jgi:hypothetical protein